MKSKVRRKEASAGGSARERIIGAAERIFAAVGFDATSLRQVALGAAVPVALVSYHFENKLGLYRAVFQARNSSSLEQRKAGLTLAAMEDDPERRLELIIKAVTVPMLRLRTLKGSEHFGSLLAREASDPQSVKRGVLQDTVDPVAFGAIELLKKSLPGRTTAEVVWAFQMIVGTMIYVMADTGRSARLSGGACDPADVDATIRYLVPLMLNGVRGGEAAAPPTRDANRTEPNKTAAGGP